MSAPPNMIDYAATRAAFKLEKPERFNFARDVIDRWAGQDPDKLAIWWVDDTGREEKRSFAQIASASCKLANALSGLGIARGDVVCVILGRQLQWWEIFSACLRMGAIVAPGTTQLTSKDLQDYVKKVTAPYKYPRKIEFVETLPKTVSGKIRRVELRKQEWGK